MIARFVLALVSVLIRGDMTKEAELLVLRHENAVLRRQVSNPRYESADRIWFAALSRLVPRRFWPAVFPVTPATILRWHRRLVTRKWTYTDRRRPGRPSTATVVKKLILQMAWDSPGWGHRRIQGALARLGRLSNHGHATDYRAGRRSLHPAETGPRRLDQPVPLGGMNMQVTDRNPIFERHRIKRRPVLGGLINEYEAA